MCVNPKPVVEFIVGGIIDIEVGPNNLRSIGRTNSKVSSFSDDDDDEVRVLQERRMKKNKVRKCWEGMLLGL
ncbi:hypothetical protein TSUD_262190 [Trifolium subterraneum]|nr:hypothetical protein TSUD_262190 [Trifolium subterraneum]